MEREKSEKKSVAVMLSTFNGGRYLEQQLDSILCQRDVEVSVYIRDDGSSDGTARILEAYASADRVSVSFGNNLGIGNSFMELLYSVPDTYDYYAFSDQDDIWDEDKLITAIRRLSEESGIALYASNLLCVDAEDRSIGLRFAPDVIFDGSLLSMICRSRCYGCTQVFNRELFLLLREKRPSTELMNARLHDSWVSASAAAEGKVFFDREPHIHYRRHGQNHTVFDKGKAARWEERLFKLLHREKRNPGSKMAREVLKHYKERVENDRDSVLICAMAEPKRLANRVELIRNRKRLVSYLGESETWFVMKVLAGLI